MSRVAFAPVVPTVVGTAGAIIDTSNSKPGKAFTYKGADGEAVIIQGAMVNSTAAMVAIGALHTDKNGHAVLNLPDDGSLYVRAYLAAGAGGGVLGGAYSEESIATGPQGPPTLRDVPVTGSVSVTDATATKIIYFTPGADGAFSVQGHIAAIKETTDEVYNATFLALFRRTGGTTTAIGITIVEQTGNLDPGTMTATVTAGEARVNFVGIAATNIHATARAVILPLDAF